MKTSGFARIELSGLRVDRPGRTLLRNLDASFQPGAFIAVTGHSGAGKSSLLSCIAGFLDPADGRLVYRCNARCEHCPASFRSRIGFVFQHLRLSQNSTAGLNVLCGLLGSRPWWRTLWGFPASDRARSEELLECLGLPGCARVPVAELSGGERQRVAIARAMIGAPEVLIADEPVSHLDRQTAERSLEFIRSEARRNACTVLCALHDTELVERFADATLHIDSAIENGWNLQPNLKN